MVRQNFREVPNVVERIVERSGRGADDVWFAEIGFHAGGFEFLMNLFRILVREDRELAATRFRIARSNQGKAIRSCALQKELEITSKLFRFLAERLHPARFIENGERGEQWGHGKNRRVTDLPTVCRRDRNEFGFELHAETRLGIVAEPAGEPRQLRVGRVALM